MKALRVDAGGVLSVHEVETPAYNDCQALCKTLTCGVCNGTDLKLIHGHFKNMTRYPLLLGHEAVGRVVEVGRKVTGLRVGDMVLLPFLYGDFGGCASGWGGYAEYTVVGDAEAYLQNGMGPGSPGYDEGVFAQTVIRPEDRVDAVGAAMVITFREVLSAIRRFGFQPNKDAVVFGAGPVGLCFTLFGKLLGLRTVIAVDVSDQKAAEALRLGADAALNSAACDVDAEIRKLLPRGADYVVDAVGLNSLINQAMGLIKDRGRICCYGISPKLSMELDWSAAPYNWELLFSQMPSKAEEGAAHSQIMAWINRGVLDPRDFISDIIPFGRILDAFALAEQHRPETKKIIIRYEED
jgi:threonine dehydrogenase-like Zn-dependent dehydrogenase